MVTSICTHMLKILKSPWHTGTNSSSFQCFMHKVMWIDLVCYIICSVPEWPREARASWQVARANFAQAGLVNVLRFVRART